ncbi:VOC family protein [Asanoa sp. WMMD1127]|uniref:VOC family protein n=1 Tax=Asanoa sp. WMMD1127 TaxID=3016107 RepID=UPI0024162D0E|nr:VOC family protein [Asanoa sp. WMMD1127]MDG4825785.1 VOC family protein [Asanoa sp. WMMD1127]
MAVGAVSQIHISVSDIERSVVFYRDVLGVPFLFAVPGQSMAFFQSGDVRLYLGVPESEAFASKVTLYFGVDDLDGERARLVEAGVQFLDEPHAVHRDEQGELWMTFFRDPDGHNLALTQVR